jgi:hypothetical protein
VWMWETGLLDEAKIDPCPKRQQMEQDKNRRRLFRPIKAYGVRDRSYYALIEPDIRCEVDVRTRLRKA